MRHVPSRSDTSGSKILLIGSLAQLHRLLFRREDIAYPNAFDFLVLVEHENHIVFSIVDLIAIEFGVPVKNPLLVASKPLLDILSASIVAIGCRHISNLRPQPDPLVGLVS